MDIQGSRSSIRRVFEPLFGKRWPVLLLLIPVIVAWPILTFWRQVAFDASDFVEEWIKLSLTTFIFYFLVEIVQERRRSELSRQDLESFCKIHLVTPLLEATIQLESVLARIKPGDSTDLSDELLSACRHAEHVKAALATAHALTTDLSHYNQLTVVRPERVDVLVRNLTELARTRQWGTAPIEDLQNVVTALKQLVSTFEQ